MTPLVISVIFTLVIALISLFAGKERSKSVVIFLCAAYLAFAGTEIWKGWHAEHEKMKSSTTGTLKAVTVVHTEGETRKVNVELGSSQTIISHRLGPTQNKFRLFQGVKSLEWIPVWFTIDTDRIKVTATIHDSTGRIVAKMVDNEWHINEGPTFDRNYTNTELEVIDEADEVVLQVVLLKDRIQFQAKLYDSKGWVWIISGEPDSTGGSIAFGPQGSEHTQKHIQRIFDYPSSLHFGERIAQ